jgi:uncharacterized protein YehS (DUF1456 family)
MTNNEILRRLRYLFDYNDVKMQAIYKLANYDLTQEQLIAWLRKENDPLLTFLTDRELSLFLNGLIIEKRGKKEGLEPEPEDPLSNNMILRKLRIALDIKTDDILELFASIDKNISKHELSSFLRNPANNSYQPFKDQYLRNFLNALQLKYRDSVE